MTNHKCPNCGRYVGKDPDEYYARLDPCDENSELGVFCNEDCCDAYYAKFAA